MQQEGTQPMRATGRAAADVPRQHPVPSLSEAWATEGFAVTRPYAAVEPAKGMALFYALTNAVVYAKTQVGGTVKCACMLGLLFAGLAFWLSFIMTAVTSSAPNPTYIVFAAILGVIIGIIASFAVKLSYRSFDRFLCTPGVMSDTMKLEVVGHQQAARYASVVLGPDNTAGVLRGDLIHLSRLLRG